MELVAVVGLELVALIIGLMRGRTLRFKVGNPGSIGDRAGRFLIFSLSLLKTKITLHLPTYDYFLMMYLQAKDYFLLMVIHNKTQAEV